MTRAGRAPESPGRARRHWHGGARPRLRGAGLGQDPPPYDARRPFRGLNPFRAEDRAFFFGREALIAELQERLADHPFLPVLGPSGSGKSSVVLAGLVPELAATPPDAAESRESR